MKLTGKCKLEFEKWFEPMNITPKLEDEKGNNYSGMLTMLGFYQLPNSMKFGLFVDFFDILGIEIEIDRHVHNENDWAYTIYNETLGNFKSRPEARTKAIEKANESYNKL